MRDLFVFLVVFGAIPYIFSRPHIGVLVFSWLSYMNPHKLGWGFAAHFPFAMISVVVTLLALSFTKHRQSIPVTPITIILFLFLVWITISSSVGLVPDESWGEWGRIMKIQLMIFVTMMLMIDKEKINQLVWVIVFSIGFFGIKGGVFTIATGGNYMVWGPEGTFIGGNNEMALALVMIIPLFWYLYLEYPSKWIRRGLLLCMVLCVFSVLGSYSRGSFLALSGMSFFLLLKSSKKVPLILAAAILIPVLASFMPSEWFERMNTVKTYEEDASAMGRIHAWRFATNLALDYPLTGGSFGVFNRELYSIYQPDAFIIVDAHSIYFEVLAEQGFVGLFLFLLLFTVGFFTAGRLARRVKGNQELSWVSNLMKMVQISLIGYALNGLTLGLAYFDLPYHILSLIVVTQVVVNKWYKENKMVSQSMAKSAFSKQGL